MKYLTETLEAAQQASARRPAVKVTAQDIIGAAPRLRFTEYTPEYWTVRTVIALPAPFPLGSDCKLIVDETAMTAEFWASVREDGLEMVFMQPDNLTPLPRYIAAIDTDAETLIAVVSIPAGVDEIHLYSGNPNAEIANDFDDYTVGNTTYSGHCVHNFMLGYLSGSYWGGGSTGNTRLGYHSASFRKYGFASRWTNLNIPKESLILSCKLGIKACTTLANDTVNLRITGEKVAGSNFNLPSYKTRRGTIVGGATDDYITETQVAWDSVEHFTAENTYQSPDVKAILEEILDEATGTLTTVVMWVDDHEDRSTAVNNTYREVYSNLVSPAKCCVLDIEYLVPGGALEIDLTGCGTDDAAYESGTNFDTCPSAACISGDYLIHATNCFNRLYISRNPTTPTTPNVCPLVPVDWCASCYYMALAAYGSRVFIVYGNGDDHLPYIVESTDGGVTWGAPYALSITTDFGMDQDCYAIAFKDADNAMCFAIDADAFHIWRAGWDSAGGWTQLLDVSASLPDSGVSTYCVSIHYRADEVYRVLITASKWLRLYQYIYDTGEAVDEWDDDYYSLVEIAGDSDMRTCALNPTSNDPFVFHLRTLPSSELGMVFQQFNAQPDYNMNTFTEPSPIQQMSNSGRENVFAACSNSDYYFVIFSGLLLYAPIHDAVDISAYVLTADVAAMGDPDWVHGNARLTLTDPTDALSWLLKGMRLSIQWGYKTYAGTEYADQQTTYYITKIERSQTKGRNILKVEAMLFTEQLSAIDAVEPIHFPTASTFRRYILMRLANLAGFRAFIGNPYSQLLTNYFIGLSLTPRSSYLRYFKTYQLQVPELILPGIDRIDWFLHDDEDESAYTYGTDHRIYDLREADAAPNLNYVKITNGLDKYSEAALTPTTSATNPRSEIIVEPSLETFAKLNECAAAIQRKLEIHVPLEIITVPLNCGQELYDVIAVQHASVGSVTRRIIGLRQVYNAGKAIYNSIITTGAV